MKYNPKIHKRRSIRLKGYDYSQAGLYFVTICCKNRIHFYGEIINGEMILNDAGKMIAKWYYELENKFPDIKCHEMIIMPNHMHFIIENLGIIKNVRADLRVCPTESNKHNPILGEHNPILGERNPILGKHNPILGEQESNLLGNQKSNKLGASQCDKLGNQKSNKLGERNPILGEHNPILGEHIGSPLHAVVQWFKTMSTNEYIRNVKSNNWKRFDGTLWQRNYWEHIIRNENSFQKIADYIKSNPQNWKNDVLH